MFTIKQMSSFFLVKVNRPPKKLHLKGITDSNLYAGGEIKL
jgi:hypothetical protein